MKKLIYILLLIPSLAFGQSAASELTDMERLERDFARPSLSQQQLVAFSLRAEQKLKDFLDYTIVLADTAYPLAMRDHLQEMAVASFGDTDARVLGIGLSEFITASRNAQLAPIKLDLESINWIQRFDLSQIEKQIGSLTFRDERGKTYEAQISLAYLPKKFGRETQYVWTLLLEKIELL